VLRDGKELARIVRSTSSDDAKVYLVDLHETEAKMGPWPLGKGVLGDPNGTVLTVAGEKRPKSLGMHPATPPAGSVVKYRLARAAAAFVTGVAYDDSNKGIRTGDTVFEVLGDGKLLWSSKPIQIKGDFDECNVSVEGVDVLELRVAVVRGSGWGAHAVWIDPHLLGASADALKKAADRRD
jgi:hypothetical protein